MEKNDRDDCERPAHRLSAKVAIYRCARGKHARKGV
jgi:hypothetical protein